MSCSMWLKPVCFHSVPPVCQGPGHDSVLSQLVSTTALERCCEAALRTELLIVPSSLTEKKKKNRKPQSFNIVLNWTID